MLFEQRQDLAVRPVQLHFALHLTTTFSDHHFLRG
jgi:hypothetical protein